MRSTKLRVLVANAHVCDRVAMGNALFTEGRGLKVKTNKPKLWSGGLEVLFREF